jgi:Probable cobalt transporter subunit (CbtA)
VPHPRSFIAFGVLAGAVGGLLAFVFARLLVEPLIQQAIDYENGRDDAQAALDKAAGLSADHAPHEVFSRTVQANLGAGLGLVLFGIAIGALVAVVYVGLIGRVGGLRPRSLALLIAAGGFLGIYLVPFLKYPANPPAIGHGATIGVRGTLYLVMVVASVTLLAGAVVVGRRLQARWGNWNAVLAAAGLFTVAIGIVMALLPSLGELSANVAQYGHQATETPLPLTDASGAIVFPGFPADVLTGFRLYSIGAQAILWAAIAVVFAPLAERLLTGTGTRRKQGASPLV